MFFSIGAKKIVGWDAIEYFFPLNNFSKHTFLQQEKIREAEKHPDVSEWFCRGPSREEWMWRRWCCMISTVGRQEDSAGQQVRRTFLQSNTEDLLFLFPPDTASRWNEIQIFFFLEFLGKFLFLQKAPLLPREPSPAQLRSLKDVWGGSGGQRRWQRSGWRLQPRSGFLLSIPHSPRLLVSTHTLSKTVSGNVFSL